ncbi:MAG: AMIN domain-containing protein, partial [Candidatus Sulfotelmatobacter sp.]
MKPSLRAAASLLLCAVVYSFAPIQSQAQEAPSVRRVQVLSKQNPLEIEIEGSQSLVPQAQILSDPDRLVVDFANAVPGAQLRNQTLNSQEIKSVRVGLFSSKPPVTRVVLDLSGPQAYQIFPSGRTVIIKIGSGRSQISRSTASPSPAALVNTTYHVGSLEITPPPPPPPLVVTFQSGLLTITSNQATLSEVLFAVHQRTGAEIAIPAGAEQEKVVAALGPAPAPEVLSHLLNGSRFNFLILSSANDPRSLDRVILSARPEGTAPVYSAQSPALARPQENGEPEPPVQPVPPAAPETKA